MPLIQIRRNPAVITDEVVKALVKALPPFAAEALVCPTGLGHKRLQENDIMIEVDDFSPFDKTEKDLHVRVIAHAYPIRRDNLNAIRKIIAYQVKGVLGEQNVIAKWYVWVLLSETSYGSEKDNVQWTDPDS